MYRNLWSHFHTKHTFRWYTQHVKPSTYPHFPYGKFNFQEIRERGQFYVDNTRFISKLEQLGDNLFFLRPPRWGKSLFENTLETYYDSKVPSNKFEELFNGLDVFKTKTTGAGKYFVLKWDFSVDIDRVKGDIDKHLYNKINDATVKFALKYGFCLDGEAGERQKKDSITNQNPSHGSIFIRNDDALSSFDSLVNAVQAAKRPLYLIVDEYDRFANKVLFENPDMYGKLVMGESGKRSSSVIRSIFERVKEASGKFSLLDGQPFRTFMVGIAPLAFYDASGPNSFKDVTHESSLGEILGFTRDHLDTALGYLIQRECIAAEQKNQLLNLMEEEYNGYQFVPNQSYRLFNPTLSLYLLDHLHTNPGLTTTLLNLRGKEARRAELFTYLEDPNTKISENVFELLAKNKYTDSLIVQLNSGSVQITKPITRKMGIKELMIDFGEQTPHFLKSLMHYYGVITHADASSVRIPNQLVREQFYKRLSKLTQAYHSDINQFLYGMEGENSEALRNALLRFSVDYFSVLDDATEPSLKARLIGLFRGAGVEADYKLYVASEREFDDGKKRVDYYLEPIDLASHLTTICLEVKSVLIHWLDPQQFKQKKWTPEAKKVVGRKLTEKTTAVDYLKLKLDQNLQSNWKIRFKSVGDYIEAARKQLQDYLRVVEKEVGNHPCGYLVWSVGMTAIHVEQVGK